MLEAVPKAALRVTLLEPFREGKLWSIGRAEKGKCEEYELANI